MRAQVGRTLAASSLAAIDWLARAKLADTAGLGSAMVTEGVLHETRTACRHRRTDRTHRSRRSATAAREPGTGGRRRRGSGGPGTAQRAGASGVPAGVVHVCVAQ